MIYAVLITIAFGIFAYLALGQRDDSSESIRRLQSRIKEVETRMVWKSQMDAAMGDLTAIINRIETEEIPRLADAVHGSNTCVEEIFMRLEALESAEKEFERLLSKHEFAIMAGKPLPVELIPSRKVKR